MNQCLGRLLLYFKITLDLVKNNYMIVVEIENQDFSLTLTTDTLLTEGDVNHPNVVTI